MVRALVAAGCVAAEAEAIELIAAAPDDAALEALVSRRTCGEPLAWITGSTRFCGLDIGVDVGVFVPRWQSESLALRAADLLPVQGLAVDLCTGSGAVARVLNEIRPKAQIVATECDPRAAACARRNGVDVRQGHLFDPLPDDLTGTVDVVVGVVPYVPSGALHLLPRDVLSFEPLTALDGGPDGLAVVSEVIGTSSRWIRSGGWLLLEIGGDQVGPTRGLFAAAGYGSLTVLSDGDGDPRAILGRRLA